MGLFGSAKTTKESAQDSCAKRERWTPEENAVILQHAHTESGVHDWDEVAATLAAATANQRGGEPRTADAVRNHYHRLLKSDKGAAAAQTFGLLPPIFSGEKFKVERTAWTPQEDEIIQRCVAEIGFKWRNIAKQLPLCPTTGKQRSDSSVRNRWSRLSRKENQVKPDTLVAGNSVAPSRRKKTVTAVTVTAAAAAAAADDDDWTVVDDVRLASVAPPAVSRRHPPFGELARYDSMREESARSWRQADDEEDIEGALSAGLRTSMSFGELALAPAATEPIAAPMLALAPAVAEVAMPTAGQITPCDDPTATVFGVPEDYGRAPLPQHERCLPDVVPLASAPSASTIVSELKDATTGTTGSLTEFNLDDFVNHVAKLEEVGAPLIVEDQVNLVGS